MTLSQLKYFLTIVKCGSINKASKSVYISQPSLSKAISDLEEEMGGKLFLRTSQGISLTNKGAEFLGYARQIIEQTELLEQRFLNNKTSRKICSISTQHYAFAVNAFVNMVKNNKNENYEYTLRETRTFEIIEDVQFLKSEIGILYLSNFNKKIINKILKQNSLSFVKLFEAKPHIFTCKNSPLANKKQVKLTDLTEFPRLQFEQGQFNSFYFSEELLSTEFSKKDIIVSDRATIFNLMIGLNGYTISSGIISYDLNSEEIIAIPLMVDEKMEIGYIFHKNIKLSEPAQIYLHELEKIINNFDKYH